MLQLLHYNAIGAGQLPDIATVVPPHCVTTVMQLARQYAKIWPDFSPEPDERARTITQRVSVCLAAIHQVISVELSLTRSMDFLPLGLFGLEAVGEGAMGAVSCIFGKAMVAP